MSDELMPASVSSDMTGGRRRKHSRKHSRKGSKKTKRTTRRRSGGKRKTHRRRR